MKAVAVCVLPEVMRQGHRWPVALENPSLTYPRKLKRHMASSHSNKDLHQTKHPTEREGHLGQLTANVLVRYLGLLGL